MKRSDETMPTFEAVSPRLPVSNVEEALQFYCEGLGFKVGWKWGNPATHANVCRDSVSLDLIASAASGNRLAFGEPCAAATGEH
jgi:catechol 2,3-dioxygenase-like lactoylglutathione lyase family enzyme